MESRIPEGQRLGNYRVIAALGAGGMGVVYRARDERLNRDVALKILPQQQAADETARARMLREAQTASALSHPHICHIYEVGEAEGRTFIAMELVEGRALSASIPQGGLPIDDAVRYGEQIADGLEHAHARNVLHRDIKSSNIIITPEGRVKILDFGLAKRVTDDIANEATLSQVSPLTQAGAIAGTLSYLAPEVLSGHAADARSDVWALGVVLYEISSGSLPFQGRTSFEVSSSILRESARPLPARVPPGLRAVIQRCLAKEPSQRYQRASEVRAALEAIGSGASASQQAVSAGRAPSFSSQPDAKGGRGVWIATGGIVGIVVFALAWNQYSSSWSNSPTGGSAKAPAASSPPVPTPSSSGGGPAQPALSGGGKPSPIPEANEYFEKAMLFLRAQFDPPRARPLIDRALTIDPKFADARAMSALLMLLQVESGVSNESAWIYKAEQEARAALAADPECAAAYGILAAAYHFQGRFEEGVRATEAGSKLRSRDVPTVFWKARLVHLRGEYAEAIDAARGLTVAESTFFPARWLLGSLLHETGDRAGAVRELGKVLEQDSSNLFVLCELARMHIENGDLRTARSFMERLRPAESNNYRVRLTRGLLLAAEGKRRDAQRELDAQVLKFAEISPTLTLHAAEYFAVIGDVPQAISWFERAVRNGDERVEWFKTNPLLASVREQPRFQQIIDSITFRRQKP